MKKIFEQLKNLKLKKFIYPSALAAFIIVAGTLFILSATFISKEINRIFIVSENETRALRIDEANYLIVTQKLGLPANTDPQILPEETSAETAPTSTAAVQPAVDKKNLEIEILNSLKVGGLAAELKGDFVAAGFSVEKIGNQSQIQKTTTIKAKDGIQQNKEIIDEIEKIVSARYAPGDIQALEASSTYDVVIVIGEQ